MEPPTGSRAASTLLCVAVSKNARAFPSRRGSLWKVGDAVGDRVLGTPTRDFCQSTPAALEEERAKSPEWRKVKRANQGSRMKNQVGRYWNIVGDAACGMRGKLLKLGVGTLRQRTIPLTPAMTDRVSNRNDRHLDSTFNTLHARPEELVEAVQGEGVEALQPTDRALKRPNEKRYWISASTLTKGFV